MTLKVVWLEDVDFGPTDYLLSMGLAGQSDHPGVQEMIRNPRTDAIDMNNAFIATLSIIDANKQAKAAGGRINELNITDTLGLGV